MNPEVSESNFQHAFTFSSQTAEFDIFHGRFLSQKNPERQFFSGIHTGQDPPISFKAISGIHCELSKKTEYGRAVTDLLQTLAVLVADGQCLVADAILALA